ncbi:MAG: hypothetical protein R3F55_03570 [Alphaproteobacteria bacterium]
MTAHAKTRGLTAVTAVAVLAASALWAAPASAQMFREPFSFGARSSASLAIFMRQRDDALSASSSGVGIGSGTSQALVCGSSGGTTASTAAGNITCVLAGNNTNVVVNSHQDSTGDQNADANTHQTAAETIGDILNGEPNG